jgi:peptidoglycan/LPS O-acetylase OafA/YrhL
MKRIPSLDGLRAISILLVVVGHLAKSGHGPRMFWDHYAELGVRVFFVISGFLITNLLLREHASTSTIRLREFYIRRAYRIFPAAFVFMLVAFAAYWHQLRWYDMAAAVVYLANHDYLRPWILGHLWSLSIEEQFYLVWPSVLKYWYRHRVAILIATFAVAPVCRTVLYALKLHRGGDMLLTDGDNLAIGCLLAIFAARVPKTSPYLAAVMLSAIVFIPLFEATTVRLTLLQLFVLQPIMIVSIAGVILHVVQVPYRLLNWSAIKWLGRISYSLYLWQQPFCADPHLKSAWLAVLALSCACLSYYFVERPMLRVRDGRRAPKTTKLTPQVLEPSTSAA